MPCPGLVIFFSCSLLVSSVAVLVSILVACLLSVGFLRSGPLVVLVICVKRLEEPPWLSIAESNTLADPSLALRSASSCFLRSASSLALRSASSLAFFSASSLALRSASACFLRSASSLASSSASFIASISASSFIDIDFITAPATPFTLLKNDGFSVFCCC